MIVRVACPACAGANTAAVVGIALDLAFCHPDVRGVVAVDRDAGMVAVEAVEDSEDLRRQVERVVALSVRSYRFVRDEPPLWRHEALARYAGDLAAFVERHLVSLGPGQYALVGRAAELRDELDRRFRAIAAQVSAESWHVPSTESTDDVLPVTGYVASHPQHVALGYRQSSVCHNVFRALRGARIGEGRTITALGTCYRHEGFRFEPLLPQWEFSMREVVLVGPPAFVASQRLRLVELTQALARELDLDARLVVATHPTKLELQLALSASASTAACSFNLHGSQFTDPMRITALDGTVFETACIGWGLERWLSAVVGRWGSDAAV